MGSSSASADGYGDEENFVCYILHPDLHLGWSFCLVPRAISMNAIKKAVLALFLVTTSLFGAAPLFLISGGTSIERDQLTHVEQSLNFSKVAMTNTWQVIIDPPDVFRKNVQDMLKNHEIDHFTDTGYTSLPLRQTHINEEYIFEDTIRWTLAHESGHLICECSSEEKANQIAYVLTTT